MLDTLLRIGEWQSQGKSKWDRFLEKPKVEFKDSKGNEIKNYTLHVIFDLNAKDIIVDASNLYDYDNDESLLENLKAIKIQGGNNKAIYVTVPFRKLNQLYKTFFGKENTETKEGEISEAIRKENFSFSSDRFGQLLSEIYSLKDVFLEKFTVFNEKKGVLEISFKAIEEMLNLPKNQNIALLTTEIKSQKYFNNQTILFAELPEYISFLEHKFISEDNQALEKRENSSEKLCYASGTLKKDVEGLNLSSRFSLNKMFVEETKNYASNFDKNRFNLNYQISKENQIKLDFASKFLLKENGLRIKIANVDHVIIPQFSENDDLDIDLAINEIRIKSDLLFNFQKASLFIKNMEDETSSIYWLNFLAYESDGNFFKSTENIKDVSSYHFKKIVKIFSEVHSEFKAYKFIDWENITKEFGELNHFNFHSAYSLIPIRKDKEKKNKALALFKTIFENRPVNKQILFKYFCELMLCHYYGRYNSYTNIPKSSKDYFSKTTHDSVFKYFAFIQILNKLKLIDMNEVTNQTSDEKANKYDLAIQDFFQKMQLNQHQKAMFYLGRMLNAVEYIQKGKKKTVIEKVNFNGMDRDDIKRLRNSLIEKAKQYSSINKVIFVDSKFGELFDYNNWNNNHLDPHETVFFLLTGYSFGITSKQNSELEETDETAINN